MGIILFTAFLCTLLFAAAVHQPWPKLLLAVVVGDEDIKIASGSFSSAPALEDSAEVAAKEFLRQKDAGNIDKARQLGKLFADSMFDFGHGPLFQTTPERTQRELHHQLLLYAYVVNRVIAEQSPNSILAQTTLNVFYSEIEAASPELHAHVSDMAAFSLYILCERKNREDCYIGKIYAGLCDFGDRQDIIDQGNRFYCDAYNFCTEMMRRTDYDII